MPLLGAVRELALPGVKLAELARSPDERGLFTEVIRLVLIKVLEQPVPPSVKGLKYLSQLEPPAPTLPAVSRASYSYQHLRAI